MSNPVILNRASVGVLCIIPRDYLSRSDVVVNAEILIPIIKFHGLRPSVNLLCAEVQRFFDLGRPVGKPAVKRHKLSMYLSGAVTEASHVAT